MIVGIAAAAAQDQRTRRSFSASALFNERLRGAARSVKTDIIALFQFVSAVFKEICTEWKLIQKTTTAYHPQTNMTE